MAKTSSLTSTIGKMMTTTASINPITTSGLLPHHRPEALSPPLAYDPHQYTTPECLKQNNNNNNCDDEKEQQGRSRYSLRQRKTQRVEESRGGGHKRRHRLTRSDESDTTDHQSPDYVPPSKKNDRVALIETVHVDDNSVSFEDIGGHSQDIKALKEIVFFRLLFPQLYATFGINPQSGLLLCGPPGTGKTLMVRALVSAASKISGQKVSFYMRKGADVLSKWVGEAERQLKLLFEEAQKNQPSIIFFDEIDGLAPARSSKQEQVHNSIVSTLLALMDGLDSRGQVVLIGATNRVDALDAALRRPGRFDREFTFSLPSCDARAEILDIHTRKWNHPPSNELRSELAGSCVGYCGADLKALCTEAALGAFREKYPQVYTSTDDEFKLDIDVDSIRVEKHHFVEAMSTITPAAHRGTAVVRPRPLSVVVASCLQRHLQTAMGYISDMFPALSCDSVVHRSVYRPWFFLYGDDGSGLDHLGPAILHKLYDRVAVHSIGLASLLSDPHGKTQEQVLVHLFGEATRTAPSVLYLPHFKLWWMTAHKQLRALFLTLLHDLPSELPVLLLVTSSMLPAQIDGMLSKILSECLVYEVEQSSEDRSLFCNSLIKAALKMRDDDILNEQLESLKLRFEKRTKKFNIPQLEMVYTRIMTDIFDMKDNSLIFKYLKNCVEGKTDII